VKLIINAWVANAIHRLISGKLLLNLRAPIAKEYFFREVSPVWMILSQNLLKLLDNYVRESPQTRRREGVLHKKFE